MKIIFLDIDGVLNSLSSSMAYGGYPHTFEGGPNNEFDDIAVKLLQLFCWAYDVKLVISSTWRISTLKSQFEEFLKIPVIGMTTTKYVECKTARGWQIKAWLDNHPVENYIILDDDSDMLPEQKDNFVHCHHAIGLKWPQIQKMIKIFGSDENIFFDILKAKKLGRWSTIE